MRKTVLLCLVLIFGCITLQAQTVSNIRAEFKPEYGYYEIKYDLSGSANDSYLLDVAASLDGKRYKDLKTLSGQGLGDATKPGRSLTLFWHPQMEGLPNGNWKFSIDTKKNIINEGMVLVEGGSFMMGSNDGVGDEKPIHEVTISSFWISQYQVTQRQWQEVMGSNPSFFKGDNLPVENVSWRDAVEYCNKRSIKEGLTPCYSGSGDNISCNWNANGYRLPTEAEWEFAARGGVKSNGYKFAGSNTLNDDYAWHFVNSGEKTHPVGQKSPNELGLYDMSGNVFEWCWDWYDSSYYSKSPKRDPRGAASGGNKVLRGGSWNFGVFYCRVAYRRICTPADRNLNFGFRVVRSIK